MAKYTLSVNKTKYTVDVDPDTPLVWVLRDHLALKGTKFGCGIAMCGACTIHLNDNAVRSCQIPISTVTSGSEITTIEGIGTPEFHPVQAAWLNFQVPQCGYCQSGQIMSAVALLKKYPTPTDSQIDAAMTGNICRCGTYDRIRKAIHNVGKMSTTK